MGFLCRDRVFSRRNRVWPRQKILGHSRLFSCRDRIWGKGQESSRRDIAFYVATMGQGTASQPGCMHATDMLCRDSVVLCCVTTYQARSARARETKPGLHDKAGALRLGAHDRVILSQQTSYSEKKKKDPLGLGHHSHDQE